MGDDETRIDLAALDSIKQALQIMLYVALSGSHGEAAVHERTDGELIDEPAVDSNDGYDSSITASQELAEAPATPFKQIMEVGEVSVSDGTIWDNGFLTQRPAQPADILSYFRDMFWMIPSIRW